MVLVATTAMLGACSGKGTSNGGTGGSGTGGSSAGGAGGSSAGGAGGSSAGGAGGSSAGGAGGAGGAQCASVSGSATITGTMLGTTLAPKDAEVAKAGSENFLIITDFSGICGLGNANKASSNALVFDFYGNAIAPGTVQVGSKLDVQYAYYDQTCNSTKGESATTGSVTFTNVGACGASGTFSVVMNNDHVSGTFTAGRCADQAGGTGTPACK